MTGPLVRSPLASICRDCAERAVAMFDQRAEEHPEFMDCAPSSPSDLSDDQLLQRIADVDEARTDVEHHLQEWVDLARNRGISWARIGTALGITRQSAWERFTLR